MVDVISILNRRRVYRHIAFWITWVIGFTFVQSFGMTYRIYLGWLVYYIVTLPIFILHTYLIVYWLIPLFGERRKYLLFGLFFMALLYLFSIIELLLSNEFIFVYFETGTEIPMNYLAPGNVLISGVGNLYIILVFLASRSIRTWYLLKDEEKRKSQKQLEVMVGKTLSKVQPGLLLYSVNQIEKKAVTEPDQASRAIALTSEILNEVMIYSEKSFLVMDKEVRLIKKLIGLNELFTGKRPVIEFFLSGDISRIRFPSLILFAIVEQIIRLFDRREVPEINIEISGYSYMATIQVLEERSSRKTGNEMIDCEEFIKEIEYRYNGMVTVAFDHTDYGCSIVIKQQNEAEPG